jgi:outer membrane protein assembly factor BamD
MVLAAMGLAACGSERETPYIERPVGTLYNTAMDALLDGRTFQAAKLFDEVERQHPYSVWATKAQLMAAYSLYQSEKFTDAILALDRFIQLHPSNPDAAYAYYLKALCYYEQISDVGRDQRFTQQALKALDEVVRRFPDSEYARDARLKIDLTHDHLAGKEMDIGRFYLRQRHYLAAINRFRVVIDQYQTTSHVPEALHRLAESYKALGMAAEARKVAAVLGHNFPGSEWYDDSYQLVEKDRLDGDTSQRGWFRRTLGTIF